MNHPEHNRNDGSALIVSAFTADEIAAFNRRHDEANGWSDDYGCGRIYTNRKRLPETVVGKPDTIWDKE